MIIASHSILNDLSRNNWSFLIPKSMQGIRFGIGICIYIPKYAKNKDSSIVPEQVIQNEMPIPYGRNFMLPLKWTSKGKISDISNEYFWLTFI